MLGCRQCHHRATIGPASPGPAVPVLLPASHLLPPSLPQVLEMWEPVTEADVQTPLEVYAELQADGYDVDYTRIPVTDEKAPKEVGAWPGRVQGAAGARQRWQCLWRCSGVTARACCALACCVPAVPCVIPQLACWVG
jgi:hypothetical protein